MSRNKIKLILAFLVFSFNCYAQKPEISLETIKKWQSSDSFPLLTIDGKTAVYSLSSEMGNDMIIKDLLSGKQILKHDVSSFVLAKDRPTLVYQTGKGEVILYDIEHCKELENYVGERLVGADQKRSTYFSFRQVGGVNDGNWVLKFFRQRNPIVFKGLIAPYMNEYEDYFAGIIQKPDSTYAIEIYDLRTDQRKQIWSGRSVPQHVTFSNSGRKLAFSTAIGQQFEFFVMDIGRSIEQIKINLPLAYTFNTGYMTFNDEDNKLILRLAKKRNLEKRDTLADVNIWSYKDTLLQSEQLQEDAPSRSGHLFFYDLKLKVLQQLQFSDYEFLSNSPQIDAKGRVVVERSNQDPTDVQFPSLRQGQRSLLLRDFKNAKTKKILPPSYYDLVGLSPRGGYLVYFDKILKHYFSYDVKADRLTNISKFIPFPVSDQVKEKQNSPFAEQYGIGGWCADDKNILIYDEFDIWKVDISGRHRPICMTLSLGRTSNLQYRVKEINADAQYGNRYKDSDTLVLSVLDLRKYAEGFVRVPISGTSGRLNPILKPATTEVIIETGRYYLMKRSSANSYSNWYMTTDFDEFSSITSIQPQKDWNWYTKELIDFPLDSGGIGKAIIYRPENFDSDKKYPVIFHIYEMLSDKFHELPKPSLALSSIRNPAWFCSRGYVVVEPDIQYKFGNPGLDAINSVVSAGKFISKQSWADSTKMALNGESFGGYGVNYIITKTNLFVAAVESTGISNMTSGYSALRGNGVSRQHVYEVSQQRMGVTMWEDRQRYINNSPLFFADKVNTPLLMMHNENDGQVPVSQGLEWYIALRRNGKKVWWLSYKGEGHGLDEEKNQIDFTTRLEQFFNHYLKGKPAPIWMTKGVPAVEKGFNDGLQLDTSGSIP